VQARLLALAFEPLAPGLALGLARALAQAQYVRPVQAPQCWARGLVRV
jgi:hypothetical protein